MQTKTIEPPATVTKNRAGRGLSLIGAAALAVAALLPWVTVKARLPVDLDLLGVELAAGVRTVDGLDTAAWPYLLAASGLAAVLAVTGFARRLLLGLGLLTMLAGGGLVYYLANVVDIETAERSALERAAVDLAVGSSVEPGPYVLLAAGAVIAVGALRRGGNR